ncbi:MAG: oxygen-independent coproporphyrinogen III oxidase [Clostridia bacterium]|nr:oxygen-independent coproporphyrinogen III oxidase [Clostridia bacterium]
MKEIGIYVHIPFCKRKCFYCDFCSFECDKNIHNDYTKALINEIRAFYLEENKTEDIVVKTLYFGGGTPSFIDENYIKRILNELKQKYKFAKDIEATIEINPGTATYEKIKKYKDIGFNRVSIGLQSTNDRLLKLIGRIHTYSEFEQTYKMARDVGFCNINVDLMIGLPTQTEEDVQASLEKIIEKNPEHISVYSLILEDGTKLKDLIDSGKLELPDEDVERKMYWLVKKKLENTGYEHYEISNFAKPGYESKHNTDCWKQKEYLAFGLAAHSYLNNVRYSNLSDLNKYIEDNLNNNNTRNVEEIQTDDIQMNEFVILGLRMIEGFSINVFKDKFNRDFREVYREQIDRLSKMKLIKFENDIVSLTDKGIDFANIVWSEFV